MSPEARTTDATLRDGITSKRIDTTAKALLLVLAKQPSAQQGVVRSCEALAAALGSRSPGRRIHGFTGVGEAGACTDDGALTRAARILEQERLIARTEEYARNYERGVPGFLYRWFLLDTVRQGARPPLWENARDWFYAALKEGAGYTAAVDGDMLAYAADPTGSITCASYDEMAKITGRSRKALTRTLEVLTERQLASVRDLPRRSKTLQLLLPVAAPVEQPAAAVHDEPVIIVESTQELFQRVQYPDLFTKHVNKVKAHLALEPTVQQKRQLVVDAIEVEQICFHRRDWVEFVYNRLYQAELVEKGDESLIGRIPAGYAAVIAGNRNWAAIAKRDAAKLEREQANERVLALLRKCAELNSDGHNSEAQVVFVDQLAPLAQTIADEFDGDVKWAEAALHQAFKRGDDYVWKETQPDRYRPWDYLPSWSWPESVLTFDDRERLEAERKSEAHEARLRRAHGDEYVDGILRNEAVVVST